MHRDWITKCFTSLQNSTFRSTIVAIDNGSCDDSVNYIKKNYPEIILIEADENLGFGKANNLGIEYSLKKDADFIFLLNQDAWVEPNTLEKLVVELEKNPLFGVVSPLHLSGDGNNLDVSFSKSISTQYCANLQSDLALHHDVNKLYEADFICAAAWLISKNCLREVGGFNPTFFHYGEDDNFVQRLHFKGLKIGVLPTCKIYHDRQDRSTNEVFENSYYLDRNQYLLNVSNPNLILTVDDVQSHLQSLLLKTYFNFDSKQRANIKLLIRYFKENRIDINNNLEISKTHLFPFLKIATF